MSRRVLALMCVAVLAATGAVADDGAITNKSMSRTIQLPVYDQDIVNDAVPEAEHAFTDMMGFYVPMQAASGIPWMFPLGEDSGVFMSPWASYHRRPMRSPREAWCELMPATVPAAEARISVNRCMKLLLSIFPK